ncbi:hypothetical protein BDZ88DRAFT_407329 [Geranomyces variabilis]|nr:hypothetical protein BDZ88DRAFT_407329 [Geranomyces variabilis]KAJ3139149.1 hypothetical protein HDU90_000512 [Geranomyces variabilis]
MGGGHKNGTTGGGPVMSAAAGNIPTPTPLPFTSSGRLTNNVLLVHSSVGKTRPSVYSLPGMNHIYGKRVERDGSGCAEVLQHWHVHTNPRDSSNAPRMLNYVAMNRGAAKDGIVSPRDLRAYRKLHPIRINVSMSGRGGSSDNDEGSGGVKTVHGGALYRKAPIPSDGDPRFTYGKPTRPSTPVADLMTDRYQREWLVQQERRLAEANRAPKNKPKNPPTKSSPTNQSRSSPKILSIAERDPRTLWKLSKFTHVPAHLDTWRAKSDPALQFAADDRRELFRVTDDKWLGLPPRELTRPIYMQDEFDRQQRAAALAAEPGRGGKSAVAAARAITQTQKTDAQHASKTVRFDVAKGVPVAAARGPTSVETRSVATREVPQGEGKPAKHVKIADIKVHAFPVADDVMAAKAAAATTDEIATGLSAAHSKGIGKETVKSALVAGLPGLPGDSAVAAPAPALVVI